MTGYTYGATGDGTNWSSERGSGPVPGGGSTGNNDTNQENSGSKASPTQKQLAAIRADKAVRAKLTTMMQAARKINPSMKMSVIRVTPQGVMVICVEGLNADQARQIGLSGLVMGLRVAGYMGAVGDL